MGALFAESAVHIVRLCGKRAVHREDGGGQFSRATMPREASPSPSESGASDDAGDLELAGGADATLSDSANSEASEDLRVATYKNEFRKARITSSLSHST